MGIKEITESSELVFNEYWFILGARSGLQWPYIMPWPYSRLRPYMSIYATGMSVCNHIAPSVPTAVPLIRLTIHGYMSLHVYMTIYGYIPIHGYMALHCYITIHGCLTTHLYVTIHGHIWPIWLYHHTWPQYYTWLYYYTWPYHLTLLYHYTQLYCNTQLYDYRGQEDKGVRRQRDMGLRESGLKGIRG